MKKIILLFICLLLSLCSVFADDNPLDNSNWGVQPLPTRRYNTETNDVPTPEEIWDRQRDQIIEGRYGSDDSPSFLNRGNMNPYDTDDGEGAASDE